MCGRKTTLPQVCRRISPGVSERLKIGSSVLTAFTTHSRNKSGIIIALVLDDANLYSADLFTDYS